MLRKIEYFWYSPVVKKYRKPHIGIADMRKKLPDHIKNELLIHPFSEHSILVEKRKESVVFFLDKFLKIEKNVFDRTHHIEIIEDEIDNYDYFFIRLRDLNWGQQINYDFSKPTCKTEACPWGAQITSPTRINSRSIRSLNLGEIYDIWDIRKRFVISKMLKDIFESEGVTGLEYEPCLVEHQKGKKDNAKIFKDRFYVAEISPSIAQYARDIFLHHYCKKHSIIISYDICNVVIPRDVVLEYDFQMINRAVVKGKEYFYRIPFFFASRRVLKILLENKIRDLRPMGVYLKKCFLPVPFEDCVEGKYHSHSRKSCVDALV